MRYTEEEIEKRTSDYVCFDCGKSFLTEEQKKRSDVVTAHLSTCGLCQKPTTVTHIRAFNWLKIPSIRFGKTELVGAIITKKNGTKEFINYKNKEE